MGTVAASESVAIQSPFTQYIPGATLVHTLVLEITDYLNLDNTNAFIVISDGQIWDHGDIVSLTS